MAFDGSASEPLLYILRTPHPHKSWYKAKLIMADIVSQLSCSKDVNTSPKNGRSDTFLSDFKSKDSTAIMEQRF